MYEAAEKMNSDLLPVVAHLTTIISLRARRRDHYHRYPWLYE